MIKAHSISDGSEKQVVEQLEKFIEKQIQSTSIFAILKMSCYAYVEAGNPNDLTSAYTMHVCVLIYEVEDIKF